VVLRCAFVNIIPLRVADAESRWKFRFSCAATNPRTATIVVRASDSDYGGKSFRDAHTGEIDAACNFGTHDPARPEDGSGNGITAREGDGNCSREHVARAT